MILNEFKEELIMNYNKNISVETDSIYEGLYEYYVNDYIVFENILKRDYLEITGVLTEADNRNFLQKFWDKIIQLIETMKQKISILIDKVTIKIDQNKIKSLTKMLNNNKALIEKTCLYNFPINIFNQPDTKPLDELRNRLKSNMSLSIDSITNENIDKIKDDIKNSKSKFSDIHKQMWDDIKKYEKADYSTKQGREDDKKDRNRYKSELTVKALTDGVDRYLNSIIESKKLKESIIKHYDFLKKQAKQKQKEYRKDKNEEELKNAKNTFNIISSMCQYDFQIIKFIIKEERNMFKNHLDLIKRVIEYSKKRTDKENKDDFETAKKDEEFFDKADKTLDNLDNFNEKIKNATKIINDIGHDFDDIDFDSIDQKTKKSMQDILNDIEDLDDPETKDKFKQIHGNIKKTDDNINKAKKYKKTIDDNFDRFERMKDQF